MSGTPFHKKHKRNKYYNQIEVTTKILFKVNFGAKLEPTWLTMRFQTRRLSTKIVQKGFKIPGGI